MWPVEREECEQLFEGSILFGNHKRCWPSLTTIRQLGMATFWLISEQWPTEQHVGVYQLDLKYFFFVQENSCPPRARKIDFIFINPRKKGV